MEIPGIFTILESVESTNNYAMAAVHAGTALSGSAWLAKEQTAGKGQRGKQWQSAKGENITMSLVLVPPARFIPNKFLINAVAAIHCVKFLESITDQKFSIKWPNDLYFNDRKAGGILIENILQGNEWNWSIIGIGINVNQQEFSSELVNPVSLRMITGKVYDVIDLSKQLHQLLLTINNDNRNQSEIITAYNSHLYKLNEEVKLKKENMTFKTRITGVSEFGQLQTEDKLARNFEFGEITWLL
jgi:BirA family transcriptional regulator, biotin operon repressor / biotin---[acetyl-CoA-carboxylase] ligase